MATEVKQQLRIGIVGGGFVGRAVARGFIEHADVRIYDTVTDRATHSLEKVAECDFIFICVPTPAHHDGRCDTAIVERVIDSITKLCHTPEQADTPRAIVIRSTVPVGFTRSMSKKHACNACKLAILHSPEFLTERCSLVDFQTPSRMIVGVPNLKMYGANNGPTWVTIAAGERLAKLYANRFPGVPVLDMDSSESEMTKLACNAFFAVKVAYFNAIGKWADAQGLSRETVREGILSDGRIAHAHTASPGPDGSYGYGGTCLVAGHYVLAENIGTMPIESITKEQRVWDGVSFTQVTGTAKREVPLTIEINARGRVLRGSADHLQVVYDSSDFTETHTQRLADVKPGDWIPVVQSPVPSSVLYLGPAPNGHYKNWHESVDATFELGYIVGLWLADGYFGHTTKVQWTMGDKKRPCADRLSGYLSGYGLRVRDARKVSPNATYGPSDCILIETSSGWLRKLLSDVLGCGYHAGGKRTPLVCGEMDKGIIAGWFDGDGSVDAGTLSGHSKSRELIAGMDVLLRRSGVCAVIGDDGHELSISTRAAAQEVCSWTARHAIDSTRYKRSFEYASPNLRKTATGWAVQVGSVAVINEPVQVYAIETASGVYEANGVLTHNCLPKDTGDAWHGLVEAGLPLAADLLGAGWRFNRSIRDDDPKMPALELLEMPLPRMELPAKPAAE